MAHPPILRQYNASNELAKERNRAAAERTLTAWIINCLTLIGFGFAFDQIFAAVHRTFPQLNSSLNREFTTALGLGAIALGLLILLLTIVEYRIKLREIEREDYLYRPMHTSLSIIIVTTILFGSIALIAVLLNLAIA